MLGRIIICIFLLYAVEIPVQAELLFVDYFSGDIEDNWTHIGDGEMSVTEDRTALDFGPEVLKLENPKGSNCIAYLENFKFTDGVITYLIRDAALDDGPDFDCDGPGFARIAQLKEEMPIAEAFPSAYTIEVDLDGGFHILWGENGHGDNLDLDDSIKTTGNWTWVKFSLIGNELKGKTWLYSRDEPRNWQLETTDDRYAEGAVALRAWSGTLYVAHIRINDRDEPYIAVDPVAEKLTVTWGAVKNQSI